MKILILGGTGNVGSEVSRSRFAWRQRPVTLPYGRFRGQRRTTRCDACERDITRPDEWIASLASCDAVVHAAASFGEDMGSVDAGVVSVLIEGLSEGRAYGRLIYTGGVWVFGNCTDPRYDTTPYAPPREWTWMAKNADRVLRADGIDGRVVHPANVVEDAIGVSPLILKEAREAGEVRVPVALTVTWLLVSQGDLGELYALALDKGARGRHISACPSLLFP